MKKHIYLIGFMGTGKSTVSKELHRRMDLPEVDLDVWIEDACKQTIPELFAQYGEAYFRDVESKSLKEVSEHPPTIVSCGGGVVLRPENVERMKETGTIVLLTATPQTVYHRVKHSTNRPVLNGNMNVEYIAQLMEKRSALYQSACDCLVTTDHKKPTEIAEEIIAFYSTL